ncbi:MAG TPA: hypothetical protein VGV35_16035 [Bryobacteraceae bacterium]|nr:hypothetical protein [Bryobacteraceae bacterium]
MHRSSFASAAALLIAAAFASQAQVLAPPEILDPGMRDLQQKHLPELKAAAVDITSHRYPYKFYLSRTMDLTERQEQLTDQRSIRFSNFQGRTVLQVTGNYFASYSDQTMNRNERVKQTYLDVVLPILRATAPRVGSEPQLNAYAVEVSHHVRKRVMGVTMERPENMALIVPRDVAGKLLASNNANEQIAFLRDSTVYVDGSPVSLWPEAASPANASAPVIPANKPDVAEAPPAAAPVPQLDISPEALQERQKQYQGLFDQIVHDLDQQAHFVGYAPPALIAFRKTSYLQLSFWTDLSPADSGSQYRNAALAFDRHVAHLVRPFLAIVKTDPEFAGVVFSSNVRIAGKTGDSTLTQSVEFFFPLAELRRYGQFDITGQQLINSGVVLVNGERVELDLQKAESDLR